MRSPATKATQLPSGANETCESSGSIVTTCGLEAPGAKLRTWPVSVTEHAIAQHVDRDVPALLFVQLALAGPRGQVPDLDGAVQAAVKSTCSDRSPGT